MSAIGSRYRNPQQQKVLLVDDEEAILTSMSGYLEMNGFKVQAAASGEEALILFQNDYFDLVVTDLVMVGMSGIEFLDAVKRIQPDSSVFILTGRGTLGTAIEALRLGADDYLLKPCDIDELILRIERFLEKRDALRRIQIYEDLLPVCMYCKKIRDDTGDEKGMGEWLEPHEYMQRNKGMRLSHGCCPECFVEYIKPQLE